MRCYVFGGSGFIGSYIIEELFSLFGTRGSYNSLSAGGREFKSHLPPHKTKSFCE